MALPFFYIEKITSDTKQLVLNEETSRHVVQVLRMQNGEQLQLTDGLGNISIVEITVNHKKSCAVSILSNSFQPQSTSNNIIAISLVKNAHRFEWFLEKATEIGITEIIPLICSRTEKQHFRYDRMKGILISAMLQSQQCWLPVLQEPVRFKEFANGVYPQQKLIAHCEEDAKQSLTFLNSSPFGTLICIGPEGDFTVDEIYQATENGFLPVALGNTRLRTETAGVVAATLLCVI